MNVINALKVYAKYFEDKICKIKQHKYFSNPEVPFKSAKNFLEKRNPKEDF